MTAHISDELPRLLTGEANRDEVMAAAQHLRGCPDCQQELVSAVVAHASLTSAQRFAPEVVAPSPMPHRDEPVPSELPDLSAVFAQVRSEAAGRREPDRQAHGGRRRWLVAAAAAVVLAGGGVAIAETVGGSSGPSGRTVALGAFGVGTKPATATITADGTMHIDAAALPRPAAGRLYEVWLTDDARQRMQSLGFIGKDNRASITVPASVMAQFRDIEVSVQRPNQTKYSGTSVLRGRY